MVDIVEVVVRISNFLNLKWEVGNGKVEGEVRSAKVSDNGSHLENPVSYVTHPTSKPGFSLIELMIVITLFGLAASLVTAGFLNFEKENRVKNAARQLVNDIRLVQNKALASDKGPQSSGEKCVPQYNLGGWYLGISKVDGSNNSYEIGGDCLDLSSATYVESYFAKKSSNLPKNVRVDSISYGIHSPDYLAIFFRPLSGGETSFHHGGLGGSLPVNEPDFFKPSGELKYLISPPPPPEEPLIITLTNLEGSVSYLVKINRFGEVTIDD